ncbi:hypothetical protein B0I33_10523 [Prauserella shujinwangii]|uniref:Uncharacterized protein n=1 Tax=Prauserella shujinwangii TaxID=1453103 RepID=A0A2T0LUC9_9PSEU|nr:hypothetical protein [Prauserella shujinwangii]PRX47445.1 hypothetical protein B0I33_10523 [Prauserella shujinwangii]
MTSSAEQPAVEELLGRLIERGYRFVHPRDERGEVIAVVGVRAHGTVVDVIRLDAEDDVTAMRLPGDEPDILKPARALWRTSGSMPDVVDAVLTLADDAFAVDRRAVHGCWVSDGQRRAKFVLATA